MVRNMFQRLIGPILTAAGGLLLAASVLTDVIGQFALARSLGVGGDPGLGVEQTAGTILGVAVLFVGIWLWRRPSGSKTVRYLSASLAIAIIIGGPLYVILKSVNRSLTPLALVEPCVQVRAVPTSAGSAGHKRLDYGVQITNTGRVAVRVDSISLKAFHDTTASLLSNDEIVAIPTMRYEQIDSLKIRAHAPGGFSLGVGSRVKRIRGLILPPHALRPLYRFGGTVFFRHRDPSRPVIVAAGADWVDNFTDECP
jgi:hypothetical protein